MTGSDIKTRYGAILLDHHHRLNGIDDLPDVVLMEILCRLPCYKFVSHCKCVSKRWCSLISDPYFISRCASLQREYNHQETPIILINQTRELLNRMSDPLKPFFERLVKFYGLIQEPEVAGAYNDLHLCYAGEYHERNYYICNPFTQQWIALPPTPPCHEKTFSIPEGFMCALPYYNNNITDAAKDNNPNNIAQLNTNYRCKVVRLISPRHGIESSKFKVQIFSSETGEWKESIVSSPQDIFLFSLKSNICFANAYNRMLYWMVDNAFLVELDPFELDGHGDDHHYNYNCRVINLEDDDLDIGRGMLGCLGVHGGRLKVFKQLWYANIFHVWDVNVKKNDQGEGEIFHGGFEKVRLENLTTYRVGRDMLPNEDDVLDCLALDPNNEEILYLSLDKEIIKFNKRTGMWSKTGKEISHSNWSIDFFQVVVPWWPTPVPILQQHAHAQPRTKNHQNQLEEEMGKFMESAPSAEVRLSSRDSCGGAAPDEEDVKVRVAKKPRTHY